MKTNLAEAYRKNGSPVVFDIRSLESFWEIPENGTGVSPANHPYEIILLTAPSPSVEVNNSQAERLSNQLFFNIPGHLSAFQPFEGMSGYRISFSESFLDLEEMHSESIYYNYLFQLFSTPESIEVDALILPDMLDITGRIMREYNGTNLFRAEILRRYFKIFLIYLSRQFEGKFHLVNQSRNIELVQKFMLSLDKKYKTQRMVAEYASELFVTPNYLNEIVKKVTGNPAGYHIRQRIVKEAKRQAAYSNSGMKEIAYYLGFCDLAHFSKFFKNATGVNFSDFKKEKMTTAPTLLWTV